MGSFSTLVGFLGDRNSFSKFFHSARESVKRFSSSIIFFTLCVAVEIRKLLKSIPKEFAASCNNIFRSFKFYTGIF